MVVIKCPIEGCSYQTEDQVMEIVVKLLDLHSVQHKQQQAQCQPVQVSAPKLNRPHIDMGVTQESWITFTRRWEAYKQGSGITDNIATIQLLQCASEQLEEYLWKTDSQLSLKSERLVLKIMESIAVIKVSIGVARTELMRLTQDNDEPFRTFATRVRGKAETCSFKTLVQCSCNATICAEYTEEVIKDVMLAGISDIDIQREILGIQEIQKKSGNDIISLVESREMGRHAISSNQSVAGMSAFKQQNRSKPRQDHERNQQTRCPGCNKMFNPFRKHPRYGWNAKPYKKCLTCWKAKPKQQNLVEKCAGDEDEVLEQSSFSNLQISSLEKSTPYVVDKLIMNKREVRRAKVADHPKLSFTIQHVKSGRSASVIGVADSGAQSNLWGLREFKEAGFSIKDLKPVSVKIRAANKNPIRILGAFDAKFQGTSPGKTPISSCGVTYVSDTVNGFFLSYDTMVDLCVLSRNFPTIGECLITNETNIAVNETTCTTPGKYDMCESNTPCQCPPRSDVPKPPSVLPFTPIESNIDKMRDWLLNEFSASTFNICPHRPLKQMEGPPIEFHVDDTAESQPCHTPSLISIHWQQKVKEDLDRDEALGVIEKVPYGTPVTWCHRMVITKKHDGTLRRTVDLSPLNKFCRRETYATESPFQLARRIPRGTYKTVTDAWNGYHSVPLREKDRHYTTFITPFGRYRYTRAPQGFVSSGDGYNRRFNAIISDFERKERCVDDTIHYDTSLEEHWWRTIRFLAKVGSAGIVLNPSKFQFSQKQVEFAGFKISEDKIEPLPKYLDAIRTFPVPRNITDIKSWFGLINQVSNYAQLRDLLAPFRPFLSPKVKFNWTSELNEAFVKSRDSVVDAIRHGVQIFDLDKKTCLRPDWSSKGVGYFLTQKHCTCPGTCPDCCENGWVITLAGSRFLSGAEKNYAAIEGEALAIAWGLEQCKYFTLGCSELLVVTDHKPLVKIFGNRTLDEIPNTRLFRLKQRTLPWKFSISYLPGKTNAAADAASRNPSSECHMITSELEEEFVNASIGQELHDTMTITWGQLASATLNDKVLSELLDVIRNDRTMQSPNLSHYFRYRDALYITDGVIMYRDRVVVPDELQPAVLRNLHAAHQGVSSMERRAHEIVFWPGMTCSIQKVRADCYHCNKNAPSNSHITSTTPDPPSMPFEKIYGDFFNFAGNHYLVIGDRLSGWSEVFSTPTGSSKSGAQGLIQCLRSSFATFGVPHELSSDGGPEFRSDLTARFLKDWGVSHRVSSAYFPASNGRAEVAVKTAKRLLRSNVQPSGSLNSDKFIRAMLQLRNTPDPDCHLSPAQIIYGRPLRDSFAFAGRLEKFSKRSLAKIWKDSWEAKEEALRVRFTKSTERLNEHSRELVPLKVGDRCLIQNQTGNHPKRWDRSGIVAEVLPFDKYAVKIDGSWRVTERNRRFLKAYAPATTNISYRQPLQWSATPRDATSEMPHSDDILVNNPQLSHESEPPLIEGPELSNPPQAGSDTSKSKKTPLPVRRLKGYNNPGLKEVVTPVLRNRRSQP